MRTLIGRHGSYTLKEILGSGGNGEVWRALGPQEDVAVKLLKGEKRRPADAAPRFAREIEALSRLDGVSGVLPLLDSHGGESSSEISWFAMPIATNLRRQLGDDATIQGICEAFAGIAGALARVHALDISHRDIKPDNLYWFSDKWCLGDFGLADFPDAEALTRSDRKLGPAYYIAPEMLNNPASADGTLADIYSLGKTLWVVATGQTYPLPGAHDPTYAAIAIRSFRNEGRSKLLDELLRRMTLLDPRQRPTAEIVARELAILAEDEKMSEPADAQSALNQLRAALVPHFAKQKSDARQQLLAESTLRELKEALRDLADSIRQQTGLEWDIWSSAPNRWGYRQYAAGPRIEWEDTVGYAFEAGEGTVSWRLKMCAKCQLLSDGQAPKRETIESRVQ